MQSLPAEFLAEALRLAREHARSGGGPFGAVITNGSEIISSGGNQVTRANDPTAHAEIVAIRAACQRLGTFRLDGCVLYASCEPCPMCLAAIYWARIPRVIFAATRADAAQAGFDDAAIYAELARPLAERTVRMEHASVADSAGPFQIWKANARRVDY
ncbi:MAG: nucleoside deaminase [Verrucomicrobia bacterium]|nr:nucleoside deaminase [Verrucomicrobiota bacterium]